jgi:hypothetical protein
MATFKFIEMPALGDQIKVPASTPVTEGDQILLINWVLVDKTGESARRVCAPWRHRQSSLSH